MLMVLGWPAPSAAEVDGAPVTATGCQDRSDSVARLYAAAFDRAPDVEGFNYWMTEYTAGRWSLGAMSRFFAEGPEFSTRYGTLTDRAYVHQLYQNVLGRQGEQEGVEYWHQQLLAGMERSTLLLRLAESPENVATTGTEVPALGYFNDGVVGGWDCAGWPAVAPAATCEVTGTDDLGQPTVKVSLANDALYYRDASLVVVGTVDGDRMGDQYLSITALGPRQAATQRATMANPVFSSLTPDELMDCQVVSLAWSVSTATFFPDTCQVLRADPSGAPQFAVTATNTSPDTAGVSVLLLVSVDAQRVTQQLTEIAEVYPGETVTAYGSFVDPQLVGADVERITCEAIGP